MARKGQIQLNERRKKLSAKFAKKRAELKAILKDPKASEADKALAAKHFARIPRNANPTRIRNRCALSGRSRAYYRKFGLSRIALRDLGLKGQIPGLIKASW